MMHWNETSQSNTTNESHTKEFTSPTRKTRKKKSTEPSNMKAMKVLMAIADDNRIKFQIVMRSVPEIGFRFEKLNSICLSLHTIHIVPLPFTFQADRAFAIFFFFCFDYAQYKYFS